MRRVVVVDDDESVCTAVGRILRAAGYQVDLLHSAEEFLATPRYPACVILDVQLPGLSGLELEQRLRSLDGQVPVVFLTGRDEASIAEIAQRTGRFCLRKPTDGAALLDAVKRAIQADWR